MKSLALTTMLLVLSICMVAQNSHIQVVAEPGISVFLDGQFKGVTSSDYGGLIVQNVTAGQHTIRVVKDGYSPREEEINIKEREVLQYNIANDFIPAIKISEEGNKEKQAISIKKGTLTVQSLPLSIRIRVPSVNIDYVKKEDKFHAENIPEGKYFAEFSLNDKVLSDSVQIMNEMITYLFVNMVELKVENKDFKHISESSKESNFTEEERRLNAAKYRARNALDNVGNVGDRGTSDSIASGWGNQGVETGTEGVRTYGPGGGTGNSNISYDLGGRSAQSLPRPVYDIQVEGKVVVEVTVDRSGTVINAVAGRPGSTTLDATLLRIAREAALKAKFNSSSEAPEIQKGTITYYFRLK